MFGQYAEGEVSFRIYLGGPCEAAKGVLIEPALGTLDIVLPVLVRSHIYCR